METEFFQRHPVFKKVNPQLIGVTQLSKKLTILLVDRIKKELVSLLSYCLVLYEQMINDSFIFSSSVGPNAQFGR